MIEEKISYLQKNISLICQRLGKNPEEITLVAVTKFAPVEQIKQAIDCGLIHIGENKVQEAQKKFPLLRPANPNLVCHLIGHLQTNKVKSALQVCDLLQSIDSFKLASEVERQAENLGREVDILLQVNTSGEQQKFGVERSQAIPLIKKIAQLRRVHVRGLMTIAPLNGVETVIRQCFRSLREVRDEAVEKFSGGENVDMKYLSMGMTQDYPIALEEGANMLRIGTAIFEKA
ncbi:MAG: YggS family pyridoxal phosphate-dependent enzyme [Candidatus Omnitrophota bacterium]